MNCGWKRKHCWPPQGFEVRNWVKVIQQANTLSPITAGVMKAEAAHWALEAQRRQFQETRAEIQAWGEESMKSGGGQVHRAVSRGTKKP